MKKRAIPAIITLFSLMLVGIIGIQALWMKELISLNEHAFDAAVYRSLEGVVAQTEKKENYAIVTKKFRRDSMFVMASTGKKTALSSTDSGPFTVKDDYETVNLKVKLLKLDTMVEKMGKFKDLDSVSVMPSEIDSILTVQLKQNGLGSQKFDLALRKKNNAYIYKTADFRDTLDAYKVNLYPDDVFGRNVKLLAAFPDKFNQVSAGVWWAFGLSVLFTLAMLSLFIYSIKMLVKHKNLLAIKNDFISHMSHEFKTPLATIAIGADTLSEKADKMSLEQITKTAQSIKEQTTRLNKDVSSVLLSTVMDEKQEMIIQPFNIVTLINQVVKDFSLIIDNKNASVKSHFTQNSIIIMGDKTLWERVFSNLMDNALKFSKETPLILINVSVTTTQAIIEFTDNGVGINKADLPHIFEKFYRSDYSNKSNIQGIGLGLNFVKRVVDMQGGMVKAVSEEGNGTSIIIEIPLNG